jgi:hypothetical protein
MVHLETYLTAHDPVLDIPQSMIPRCTSDLAMCSYSFQVKVWSPVSPPRRNPLSTRVSPGNRRTVSQDRPGLYIRNCSDLRTGMLNSHRKLTEESPHSPDQAGVSIRSVFDGVSLAAQSWVGAALPVTHAATEATRKCTLFLSFRNSRMLSEDQKHLYG